MEKNKMKGLFAAPFTPMYEDGSLNLNLIPSYARMLLKDGVKGIFVCGTTGEGMALSIEERKQVAEAWIPFQSTDFAVMVHVGTNGYQESRELAKHAADVGAVAIGAMAPPFLPPKDPTVLLNYCQKITEAAPDTPFYFYHIPSVSGSTVSIRELLIQAEKAFPQLAGIKFSHSNLMEIQHCLRWAGGKYQVFHGFDEYLLAGWALGVRSAIGSTYNYMTPLYQEMIRAFESGHAERARELQYLSVKVIDNLFEFGGIATGKALMKIRGLDVGPPRSPLQRLSDKDYAIVEKRVGELGVFVDFPS